MNTETAIAPTYKQMLEEVGKQLKERKSSLLKRTLLITWPMIALFVIGYLFQKFYDVEALSNGQLALVVASGIILVVCAVIYSSIVGFIFEIEKQIWIDSYFDKKNLSLSESWNIARKLFWKAFKFRLRLAWQYYLMPIGAVVIVAALLVYAATLIFTSSDDRILVILFSMAGFLLSLIALAVYSYYIKIKLRYTWFLFMDMYGTAYSYDALVAEMNKLNDISKSDTFKKSLVANLGTDSVKVLTQSAVSMISRGMSYFGGEAGRVLGAITQIYAQEATRQITDLANIAAQYILYRFARKELRGEEQAVNETLYQLK